MAVWQRKVSWKALGNICKVVYMQGSTTQARGMMLVPQKPYMALGTLRQQLLYPVFDAAIVSEALLENEENFSKGGLLDFESHPAAHQETLKAQTNGDGSGKAESNGKAEDGVDGTSEQSVTKAEGNGSGNGKRSEQVPAPPDDQLLACLETVRTKLSYLLTSMHVACTVLRGSSDVARFGQA